MKVPVKKIDGSIQKLLEEAARDIVQVVPVRKKRKKPLNAGEVQGYDLASAIPDPRVVDRAATTGKRMLTRIREVLSMSAVKVDDFGCPLGETRLDTAAMAYVDQMEAGSFIHTNAIIEREDGKIGVNQMTAPQIKMYINMPTDGEEAT